MVDGAVRFPLRVGPKSEVGTTIQSASRNMFDPCVVYQRDRLIFLGYAKYAGKHYKIVQESFFRVDSNRFGLRCVRIISSL